MECHPFSLHTRRKNKRALQQVSISNHTYSTARLVENNFLSGFPARWPSIACSHSVVLHDLQSNCHSGCRATVEMVVSVEDERVDEIELEDRLETIVDVEEMEDTDRDGERGVNAGRWSGSATS